MRGPILNRRCFSSEAGGGSSNKKEGFKSFLLDESDYKSVPGLRDHIDALLEVLEPAEVLIFFYSFRQDIVIKMLDILSPQDIQNCLKEAQRRRELEGGNEVRRMSAEESEK